VPHEEVFDVIVAGFGFAGGVSALNAAQCGARTLLLEKSSVPGGLSVCSYGAVRSARNPELAFQYLKATNDGRTPDDVVRALALGMCDVERYVRELARINGATITTSLTQSAAIEGSNAPYVHEQRPQRRNSGNYPLPGTETFYHTTVEEVPGFDARSTYPWANGAPDGPKLFRIVHDNLKASGVDIRLGTPVVGLIADPQTREVRGVRVAHNGEERAIMARRAVILATGGFEGDAGMQLQFLEGKPMLHAAGGTNTGDGIRMAQHLGAALWHMWHIHGA
jgi:succinate dehydrogenase/fumarate reductase flavoprotein subunit